uniref:Uncharacterized protein n=1 Tax=Utricularia reniformis TaxID=192314 RepID=A0A1Y0B2L0_9LAMI|nr:hypothetical protein AEK19_MT1408 [Utricularia reniformis]ART31603.1 hypothetical protein AEK19_MT1408 [Utricularia reniformis]
MTPFWTGRPNLNVLTVGGKKFTDGVYPILTRSESFKRRSSVLRSTNLKISRTNNNKVHFLIELDFHYQMGQLHSA